MDNVEQVFLHTKTGSGYRSAEVLASTSAVRPFDLDEIVNWFSESEEEAIIRYDQVNLFFQPLPSGRHALGIIYPCQRGLYSLLRPPKSFYVRILIVSAETLLKKGNNPIAVFDEFRRKRKIPLLSAPPKRLRPLVPSKTVCLFDRKLLKSLTRSPGPYALAALNQSMFDTLSTFFAPGRTPTTLAILNGLINMLPIRFRTELTFSTELYLSQQNPLRLVGVSGQKPAIKQQIGDVGIPIVFTNDYKGRVTSSGSSDWGHWARFVLRLLETGNFAFLEQQLFSEYKTIAGLIDKSVPFNVNMDHLQELAAFWLKSMNEETDFFVSSIENAFAQSDCVQSNNIRMNALQWDNIQQDCVQPAGVSADSILANHARLEQLYSDPMPDLSHCVEELDQLIPLFQAGQQQSERPQNFASAPDESINKLFEDSVRKRTERFPELKESLAVMDDLLSKIILDDQRVQEQLMKQWQKISAMLPWDDRDRLREEYLNLIRTILIREEESVYPRSFQQTSRLFDILLLFLNGMTY